MGHYRNTARAVGVLYILGTVAGILSATQLPVFGTAALPGLAGASTSVLAGSFLVLIMGFSLAMIPIVVYPVLRQFDERLAVGYVVFRGALETAITIAWVAVMYSLLTVSRELGSAGGAENAPLLAIGAVLDAVRDVIGTTFLPVVFTLGALMFYTVLYRSRLVPRWLSGFGLVAAFLYLAVSVAGFLALVDPDSTVHIALAVPIALQEMALAIWLIVRGFNDSAFEPRSATASGASASDLGDVDSASHIEH